MRANQSQAILDHLKSGNTITPMEALDRFGCFRLGARIYDLKKQGYKIESHIKRGGDKHYSEYKLN